MLAANVCTAQLLEKSKLPALFRVHEGPAQDRLENLREFLAEIGLGLAGGDSPSPKDYQAVLEQIADRPDAHVIQQVMLRSMSRAEYRDVNEGHFGLNYEAYTHFTSPIRRYPDLLVHRAIRALLRSKKKVSHLKRVWGSPQAPLSETYPYNQARIAEAGAHSSFTERRADEATREVETWLKCEYLLDKVGDEYTGVVTAVVGFGLFVELTDLFVEGLVHITGLPKDYYYHEAAHHRLVGERTRRVFRLGDTLRVRVARVDLEERKVDFELVDEPDAPKKGKGRGGKGKKDGSAERDPDQPAKRSKRRRRSKKSADSTSDKQGQNSSEKEKPGGEPQGKSRRRRR